ncbi:MAG: hypothetical protein ACYDGM_04265, partial [Vulcanimicrobiaceae bacterium]
QFRMTYFADRELNRIDVLPVNFRSAVNSGQSPSGVGVPTNAGELRARGFEVWIRRGGVTLNANALRAYSSSASQFAYNGLNAAAAAAGHLFPIGYVPAFSATLSDLIRIGSRVRVTPSLSYESGYPYGNGTQIWVFDPGSGKPKAVPNDNYVNPGYNYYFLRDPSKPFDATSNPYIGSLGTAEGSDPNSLRTHPQLLASLHVATDISSHVTAILDVANLLGIAAPTALQGNPYLIGPSGYTGGNPLYAAAYQAASGHAAPYVLGNGIPTNDGVHQIVPWSYGTTGYVPSSYPLARSVSVRLRFRL